MRKQKVKGEPPALNLMILLSYQGVLPCMIRGDSPGIVVREIKLVLGA
jgi:hypothetical protein